MQIIVKPKMLYALVSDVPVHPAFFFSCASDLSKNVDQSPKALN